MIFTLRRFFAILAADPLLSKYNVYHKGRVNLARPFYALLGQEKACFNFTVEKVSVYW